MDLFVLLNTIIEADKVRTSERCRSDEIERVKQVTAPCCGNCSLWMTRGCVPEQRGTRKMSVSDTACRLYSETYTNKRYRKEFGATHWQPLPPAPGKEEA